MTDQIPDEEPMPTEPETASGDGNGWRSWLGKPDSHGRPMGVYLILAAGVLTLVALMLAVYLWSGDRTREDQPICTTIDAAQARQAVVDGQVERFTLTYSAVIETPDADGWGPVQASLNYSDGRCAYLPQGVSNQQALYAILGAITFYNETTESAQIEVVYSGLTDMDPVLFETPTSVAVPTEIPETEEPATPAATPTPSPSPTPTEEPSTPAATPDGTPIGAASPTARLGPTVTPSPTPTEAPA